MVWDVGDPTLLERESLERNDRYRAIAREAAPGPIAAAEEDDDDVDIAASPLPGNKTCEKTSNTNRYAVCE